MLVLLAPPPAPHIGDAELRTAVAAIERAHGGRLGVAFLDTGTGRRFAYRGDARFPMGSTYKILLAACVLARVDAGRERLSRRVPYGERDLVAYSPTTGKHVGKGLAVGELCEAAVVLSDNTAANLLLRSLGGPTGLTASLRRLGDRTTRLDRTEPALNEAKPGDLRDTTTPNAMLETLNGVLLGSSLSPVGRRRLTGWAMACQTGDARIRAGVPLGWRVGDKTGTGGDGATNDVAVVWPPGRAPLVIALFSVGSKASEPQRSAVLARVARLLTR